MIPPEIPSLFEPHPRDEPHRVQASFLRSRPLFFVPFDGFLLSLDQETYARDQEKEKEWATKTLPTGASAKTKSLSSRDQTRRVTVEMRDFQKNQIT